MRILSLIFLVVFLVGCNTPQKTEKENSTTDSAAPQRIISLSGTITELLYELNLGDRVVGVDVTSTYPEAANKVPKLGHVRQLNPEAILALKPDLILVEAKDSELKTIELLKQSKIAIEVIPVSQDFKGPVLAAKSIAKALELDKNKEIESLEEKLGKEQAALQRLKEEFNPPKVLFIYARGTKTLMVAGENTVMEKMIELAGGQNAVSGFKDFKALTPEALLEAQPEIILLFESGYNSLASDEQTAEEGLLSIPGLAETPAGKLQQVITMDGQYISGFGPRLGAAALELAKAFQAIQNQSDASQVE